MSNNNNVTIINSSNDLVRVAIYKKPSRQPSLNTIAWKIVAPPSLGGLTTVPIPGNFSTFVNYSFDPTERLNPNAGNQTAPLFFDETSARFVISSSSTQDRQQSVALMSQSFQNVVMNEVHLDNEAGFGVWGHIQLDGADIFPPRVISPGRTLMEDVRATLFLAVIDQYVFVGDRLVQEELDLTETQIVEGQTAVVTGNQWDGYAITVT